MKKLLITLSLGVSSLGVAFAQPAQNLVQLLAVVQGIVNRLLPLTIGLAVVVFFFGLIMFIVKRDTADHDKWLKFMGMSILALFVMVSLWGLVSFFGSIFGITSGGSAPRIDIPTGPSI